MYNVGQIIYVVLNKQLGVVPARVVEEITKKNLQGLRTTYSITFADDPEKIVLIENVPGEAFETYQACEKTLIDRATEAIQGIMQSAAELANRAFVIESDAHLEYQDVPEDDVQHVQLPDGTVVKARIKHHMSDAA